MRRPASLAGVALPVSEQAAVTVVLAAGDYPERGDSGTPISGSRRGGCGRHSSSMRARRCATGGLVTNGGRILNVTGLGDSVAAARAAAYEAASHIDFAGVRFRRDIAHV